MGTHKRIVVVNVILAVQVRDSAANSTCGIHLDHRVMGISFITVPKLPYQSPWRQHMLEIIAGGG